MKRAKILSAILVLSLSISATVQVEAKSTLRNDRIERVLDTILEVCIEEWPEMHGFPTCCAMMAAQESGFGKAGRPNNLWGLGAGKNSYDTLEDGIRDWLWYVNTGWYGDAANASNCDEQLSELLDHGYCQPPGKYYSYCMTLKEMYDLAELDELMVEELERREKEAAEKAEAVEWEKLKGKEMILVFDPSLMPWQVITHEGVSEGGVIQLDYGFSNQWLDVVSTKEGNHPIIYTGDRFQAILVSKAHLKDRKENAAG